MDMPVVAGMDVEGDRPNPPAMAGAVAGVIISLVLWAAIAALLVILL